MPGLMIHGVPPQLLKAEVLSKNYFNDEGVSAQYFDAAQQTRESAVGLSLQDLATLRAFTFFCHAHAGSNVYNTFALPHANANSIRYFFDLLLNFIKFLRVFLI